MSDPNIARVNDICAELANTLSAKNANYGNAAGSAPYFLPWLEPDTALWVRLSDKVSRLRALNQKEPDKVGESLRDTLLDLAGYAVLLVAEIDSKTETHNNYGE